MKRGLTNSKKVFMIRTMKKFLGFIGALGAQLLFVTPSFAATINICPGGGFAKLCNIDFDSFPGIVTTLINLALIAAVVIALFFLIYGGIKWVLSGGDKTAVEAARNHIVAAIVGLAIALLAFFILNIIGGFFGITLRDLQLPKLP